MTYNILQDQTSFCHDKQHGFVRSEGKCSTYQNYTYHTWYHWMCEVTHSAKGFGTQFWCMTILTTVFWSKHKLCSPCLLCGRGCKLIVMGMWVGKEGIIYAGGQGCSAGPHPIYGATGTCQCSYLGMDH